MAFKEGTLEFTVGGNGALSGTWAYADVTITSSGSKVNWEISMRTPANGSGKIPYIQLYFKIDGQEIFNKYYSNVGKGFPCKNGSSDSGSITLTDTKDTSIPVVLNMGVATQSPQYKVSKTLTRTYYTSVGSGTIEILDNGNNTFTINGTKGSDGTNNPAKGPTINWGYTNSYGNTGSGTKQLTIVTTENATRKVYAKCVTGATYGSGTTVTAEAAIKQYVAPSANGSPSLSYEGASSGKRLTLKTPWTFTWSAATQANSSSPVSGYRIRLYKNGALVTGLTAGNSNTLTQTTGTNGFLDRDSISTTVVLENPASFGFKAKDTVQLSIVPYTKYGNSASGRLYGDEEKKSSLHTIQNAAVVSVCVDGNWVEGQVCVNVDGNWVEAESVNVNVDGNWVEAQ